MFESLEKRRRNQGSLWKAFGVVTSIFALSVVLWMKCSHMRDGDDAIAVADTGRCLTAGDAVPIY